MRSPQLYTASSEPTNASCLSVAKSAPECTRSVMREIVQHVPSLNASGKTRIARLVRAGAWTEAALALIEIEQPQWKLRRLVYEDGEWLCSLSQQPNMPIDYDDVAESRHEVLPLAILGALAEARQRIADPGAIQVPDGPRAMHLPGTPICCDNFS
jgi:hypothetical protein